MASKNELIKITMKDGAKLAQRLQKLETGGEAAIKRTVSDFKSRAPGWVSKGIRAHYGITPAGVKSHAPKIKTGGDGTMVAGIKVDGAALEYEGELLTPLHFKMKPKARPARGTPGQISAEFTKGQRKNLPPSAFLASAKKKDGEEGPTLPFQRRGSARYPVDVIKTVSVPQMIDNKAHDEIEELITENLGKRFDNHIKQIMK